VVGQLGLEQTPEAYVKNMVAVFREVWRVLRDDGTLWLNLGDSYIGNMSRASNGGRAGYGTPREGVFDRGGEGLKNKDLAGIPWRVAFALQSDGWYLRQDIIWHKSNPMPESVKDRCTKSHEYIFLLTKNKKYYYDNEAIKEESSEAGKIISLGEKSFSKGQARGANKKPSGNALNDEYEVPNKRNRRSVWTITTKPYSGAHYAVFPPEIPGICIKAGSKEGDIVLDPFVGSGTTVMVARNLGRIGVGLDLSLDYLIKNARVRLGLDKLDAWTNGAGKKVESGLEGLPMFGGNGETQKDHKNVRRKDPHSMHKARLKDG